MNETAKTTEAAKEPKSGVWAKVWQALFVRKGTIAAVVGFLVIGFFGYAWAIRPSWLPDPSTAFGHRLHGSGIVEIDSPEIYTRERLVNDRFIQDNWLRRKLGSSPQARFGPTFSSSTQTSRRAEVGLGKEAQGGDPPAQAGSETAEATGSAPDAPDTHDELDPYLQFQLENAYRQMVRSLIIENQLDDRHDLQGNSLYMLKFDASIVPNAGSTSPVAIDLSASSDGGLHLMNRAAVFSALASQDEALSDWRRLYRRWLEHTSVKLNRSKREFELFYADGSASPSPLSRDYYIEFARDVAEAYGSELSDVTNVDLDSLKEGKPENFIPLIDALTARESSGSSAGTSLPVRHPCRPRMRPSEPQANPSDRDGKVSQEPGKAASPQDAIERYRDDRVSKQDQNSKLEQIGCLFGYFAAHIALNNTYEDRRALTDKSATVYDLADIRIATSSGKRWGDLLVREKKDELIVVPEERVRSCVVDELCRSDFFEVFSFLGQEITISPKDAERYGASADCAFLKSSAGKPLYLYHRKAGGYVEERGTEAGAEPQSSDISEEELRTLLNAQQFACVPGAYVFKGDSGDAKGVGTGPADRNRSDQFHRSDQ